MKKNLITLSAVALIVATFFMFSAAQAAENQITLEVSQASGLIFADYTAQESSMAGIALYDQAGQLANVRFAYGNTPLQLPLPETLDGYQVKAFLWNQDQAPLAPDKEIALGGLDRMSDYPAAGVVDSVEKINDETIIHFSTAYQMEQTMKIRKDAAYEFILNGEKIGPTQLMNEDTLAVCYDSKSSFAESDSYKILVTRGNVYGTVLQYDENNGYCLNNNKYYKPIDASKALTVNSEYELFVDAFGRIIAQEDATGTLRYGILENVYLKNGEEVYMARLVTTDGEVQTIPLHTKISASLIEDYARICNVNGLAGGEKNPIAERVVEYRVKRNSGEVSFLAQITPGAVADSQEYKANVNKIGSIRINDTTKFLNATNYDKDKSYSALSLNELVDGYDYTAVGFNKINSICHFVIILDDNSGYSVNTPIAIYSQIEKRYDEASDQQLDSLVVYTANADSTAASAPQSFLVKNNYSLPALTEGDVIVYNLNSDGYVDDVQVVFDTNMSTYSDFRAQVSSKLVADGEADPAFSKWVKPIDKWIKSQTSYDKNGKAEVFFGPLSQKNGNDISIAKVSIDSENREVTAENDVKELTLAPDANVYVYNYAKRHDDRLSKASISSIRATNISSSSKLPDANGDKTIINWSDSQLTNIINYIFVKTIDGDVTDAYFIAAPLG